MNRISHQMFSKTRLTIMLLIALCLVVAQVNAASLKCRSDPIVFLSNGVVLQINTIIDTSVEDIVNVNFTVHVPAGVSIKRVIYAPSWAKAKEHVILVNDQPANTYLIVTVAQTVTPNVPMEVVSRKIGNGGGLIRKSATGLTGQAIAIGF